MRIHRACWATGTVTALLLTAACGSRGAEEEADLSGELDLITVGMSAFQDTMSVYVGVEQGIFEDHGIELEFQNTDWSGANELMVGEQVDIATSSDADIILQNSQGVETTLAFPLYYFAGGALMYDPERFDWRPYEEFLEESDGNPAEAMTATLEQLRGRTIGVDAGGGEYATFIDMIGVAGLPEEEFEILDFAMEDLPPALFSESVDVMISGIPQRLAALEEGYEALMDQTAMPSTVVHGGFGTHRTWLEDNWDLAVRFQTAIFETLTFIEQNPDESYPIIAEALRSSGTVVDPDSLYDVWNSMEFFLPSVEAYEADTVSPEGRFYWVDRFEGVISTLEQTGKIDNFDVPLEELNQAVQVVEAVKAAS